MSLKSLINLITYPNPFYIQSLKSNKDDNILYFGVLNYIIIITIANYICICEETAT